MHCREVFTGDREMSTNIFPAKTALDQLKCLKTCEYARRHYIGPGYMVGCHCEPYKGKWVEEIDECPLGKDVKSEQVHRC